VSHLVDLVDQLPTPLLLCGDFNAHSPMWRCQDTNPLGITIENFLQHNDLCVLNNKLSTYLHPATGNFSAIDLSVCSPALFLDFKWEVAADQHGSDHFPIIISTNKPIHPDKPPRWKLHKADWDEFQALCLDNINPMKYISIEDPVSRFTSDLTSIACKTIPQTSTSSTKLPKPWFNAECCKAVCLRKAALYKFKCRPTHERLQQYRAARANARRVTKQAKRESWQHYISSLNSQTPVKKTWDMISKITGKYNNHLYSI
jgi:hypothetical protein